MGLPRYRSANTLLSAAGHLFAVANRPWLLGGTCGHNEKCAAGAPPSLVAARLERQSGAADVSRPSVAGRSGFGPVLPPAEVHPERNGQLISGLHRILDQRGGGLEVP